jgi:hypothetical protein
MTRKLAALFVISCFWLWTGCAAVIIGAGLGAGTYTYIKGDLKRAYNAKFDKTLNVCLSILTDLNQPILEKTTDGEQTTIRSERKNGSPQTISVSMCEAVFSDIGIERCQSSFMSLSRNGLNDKVRRFSVQLNPPKASIF